VIRAKPTSSAQTRSTIDSGVGGGGGGGAKYKAKYQQTRRKSQESSRSNTNNSPENSETRLRIYKAEAYEAKIRSASQEQRVNTLQKELDELRFYSSFEQQVNGGGAAATAAAAAANDPPTDDEQLTDNKQQSNADKDAELIECLATELEGMEKELNDMKRELEEERAKNLSMNDEFEVHQKLMLGDLQHQLDAEKSKNHSLSEELSLLVARGEKSAELFQAKEAELKKTIETQQTELNKSKSDNAQVATTLREIEGAVVRLQQELDDEKSKNKSLNTVASTTAVSAEKWQKREADLKQKIERQQKELSKWKKDTADGVTIMRELEAALRKARRDNAELRNKVEEKSNGDDKIEQVEEELRSTRNERDALAEECHRLTKQAQVDATNFQQDLLASTARYEEQKKEADEMRLHLDDLANAFEKQKIDLELKSSAIEELEEIRAREMKESENQVQNQKEELAALQLKYQSQMLMFQSQIDALRSDANDGPDDEVRAEMTERLKQEIQDTDEKRRLEREELSSLRARISEAEGTESRLRQQLSKMQTALEDGDRPKDVSTRNCSLHSEGYDSKSIEEFQLKRQQIENEALKDYLSQRMLR
jgi:chromosome segregation ATPase